MKAKPNQKVKCVNMSGTANPYTHPNLPIEGETYTVREVAPNGQIWLKEITNPRTVYEEGTFSLHRFVDLETGKSLESGDGLTKIFEICLWLVTTPKGFLVFLGIAALFFAIVGNNHNGDSSNNSNASMESQSPPIPSQQAVQTPVVAVPDNKQSDVMPTPSTVVFTRNSNGHDWQRADFQTRQQFCQTIAAAESKEFNRDFTADFYYSALDAFYTSSDPNILGENIHTVIGLTTSAAISGQ
ncbi:MAG TPA: hypothetical protein VIK59_02735 [Verrucomicrobiae bacterium]